MKQFFETTVPDFLQGGLRVIYTHRLQSRLFCISMCLGMGNLYEKEGERGISALTQESLIKGTQFSTAEEVSYRTETLGATIDVSSNFFTGKVRICGPAENFRSIIELFCEIVTLPSFPHQEVNREKRYLLRLLSSLDDDPFRAAVIRFKQAFFGDSALAYPIEGRKEDLELLNEHTVRTFHHKVYSRNNCVLAVAGRFDQKEVQDLLNSGLASLPQNEAIQSFPIPQARAEIVAERRAIHDCWLIMGTPAPSMQDKDGRAAFDILNNVLGGGMYSRLFIRVREELGLSYQVGSMYVPFPGTSFLAAFAGFSPLNLGKVVEVFNREFKNIAEVERDEFEEVKNYISGTMLQVIEKTDSFASLLAFCEHTGLGWDFFASYREIIKNIRVSEALEWWDHYSTMQKAMGVIAPVHFSHPLLE